MSDCLQHGLQHIGLPCPSSTPGACSNTCPLSWWCHPAISSSVIHFSSCLQSFPASQSFPMSQFTSGDQSIGISASPSVILMNSQDWFPLGLTGLISLQSKGLSRVFSNTTVQKQQFFSAQLYIYAELLQPCPTLCSPMDCGISLIIQLAKNLLQCRRPGFKSRVGKIPRRRKWKPPPVFLPGESQGERSLAGYSMGSQESGTTE